jgi:pimeloyl-ACP methyl ester carboxylesterase
MTQPVRKSVALPGGSMSYLEWEGDGPWLHFTHANGFNAETYRSILQPLAGRFRITANDQRGHGFTKLPTPEGFARGWKIFGEDLVRFLDALGGGKALLAGHSMGGVASLMAAGRRPDLAAGLLLIEPVFIPPVAKLIAGLTHAGQDSNLASRAAKRRDVFPGIAAIEDSYRGRGAFKGWSDAMLQDYLKGGTLPMEGGGVRLACSPRVESECFALSPTAAWRFARDVKCKATLIRGEGAGSSCRAAQAAAFLRRKPDARIVSVAEAGHFLPMERPDVVRDEILRFADRG